MSAVAGPNEANPSSSAAAHRQPNGQPIFPSYSQHARHLVPVTGDQLDKESAPFDGFDPRLNAAWMAEVAEAEPARSGRWLT